MKPKHLSQSARRILRRNLRRIPRRLPMPLALCSLLCSLALLAASCSDLTDDDGTTLPPGKYPMTFTASVDGLAATRAVTDNSWEGGEEVAIQIGNEVKKYTTASGGSLTVASDGTPFYWQNKNNVTVSAWYPYNATKPADAELKVKANQSQGNNYQASDYLEAMNAAVTFNNPALTFKHRTAKVVVTLKTGEGVTDLTDATVILVNQTGVEDGGTKVTPKKEIVNGTTTYTALLIPQQMQGKQFIKVTIGAGDAARDYFYIPTGNNDANLEAGKQYAYTITVKKSGLEVESVTASWNDNSITPGTPTEATFQVHLPGSHGQTLTVDGATQVASSDVYTIDNKSNPFSISYTITEANKAKGFLIAKGIGNGKRTISDNTCTFTYSNIRSDIWLNYTLYAEVGYYYYNDGTCSPDYTSGSSPACIGIVFKTGAGEGDNISNYTAGTFADNVIHGYVVALKNIDGERKSWGNISNVSLHTDNAKFYGYSNTQAIKNAASYDETNFWACYQAINYPTAAPISSTSGWYLPSLGEYNALWQVYSEIQSKLTDAGGTDMKINYGFYWTSSKKNSSAACVDFGAWSATGSFTSAIRTDNAYVRPVLTF